MSDTTVKGEEQVKALLLKYAWLGNAESEAREVACIMAQGGWEFIEDVADRYASAQETGGGPEEFSEGVEYAVSALYECHGEPHLSTCPALTGYPKED